MSFVGIIIWVKVSSSDSLPLLPNIPMSISAERLPISQKGWEMVVSAGFRYSVNSRSSTLMTEKSSGIFSPRCLAVRYAAMARSQLTQKMASGRPFSAMACSRQ